MPDILKLMIRDYKSFKISKRSFEPYLHLGVNVFKFTPSLSNLLDYWLKGTDVNYCVNPYTDIIEFTKDAST